MTTATPLPHAGRRPRAMPLLEFHRTLLADRAAQDSFRQAIDQTVRAGDAVLDVGTGTGLHAMFACRAGARVVYAVDDSPVIDLARAVALANGFDERIVFVHAAVQDIAIPEQVDVISAHLGLVDTLALVPQVVSRHLRAGGTVIPAGAELYCAPVESHRAYEQIDFWAAAHYGFSFEPIRRVAVHSLHAYSAAPAEILGDPVRVGAVSFSAPLLPLTTGARFEMLRDGQLHGVAMWYVEHLSSGLALSSGPASALDPRLWRSHFFPCEHPRPMRCGDIVTLELEAAAGLGDGWRWQISA